jgi:hypothetical protein
VRASERGFDVGNDVTALAAAGGGSNMTGATTSAAGTAGLVPAPSSGSSTRALFSDASFAEVPLFPSYKQDASGYYIANYTTARATGNANLSTAKQRRFCLVYIPRDGEIDVLACRTNQPPASSVNIHVGLWSIDGNGLPGDFVAGGIVSSGTSADTALVVNLSPSVSVKRGLYYAAATPAAAVNGLFGDNANAGDVYHSFVGVNAITMAATFFAYTATDYDQTTHQTITLLTTSTTPKVYFQYA